MLQLIEYLKYLYCNFCNLYLTTQKNNQFYLGIQYGATGACYAKLIKIKSQTFNIFQKFICQVERQLEKKLRHLHINFEKVFANQAFKEYTAKKDIK